MRVTSLRALLLALAMVIQTLAGAGGVAHARIDGAGKPRSITAPAWPRIKRTSRTRPAGLQVTKAIAPASNCLLCAAGPDAAVEAYFSGPSVTRVIVLTTFLPLRPAAVDAYAQTAINARGPPAMRG